MFKRDNAPAIILFFLIAVVLLTGIGSCAVSYYGEDTHTGCVVTDKDRTRNDDGSSDARVYTENCGTFQVADTIVKGNFNSGDLYGSLVAGHTYDLTTIGFRSGVLSEFPNIIKAVEVDN